MNPKPWYVIDPYTGEAVDSFWTHGEAIAWVSRLAEMLTLVGLKRPYKIRRCKDFL